MHETYLSFMKEITLGINIFVFSEVLGLYYFYVRARSIFGFLMKSLFTRENVHIFATAADTRFLKNAHIDVPVTRRHDVAS